jgi:thiol:disulfide interchange protein
MRTLALAIVLLSARVIWLWRNHSLTIVLTGLGLFLTVLALYFVWPLEPDRWFDILSGFGSGVLTVALFNWLSGPLREKNKPEEP